jgi:hypothetical protein
MMNLVGNITDFESDVYADNFVRVEILDMRANGLVNMKYTVINSKNERTATSIGPTGKVAHA